MTLALALSFDGTPALAWAVIAALGLLVLVLAYGAVVVRRRRRSSVEDIQHATVHVAAIVDAALDAIVTLDEKGRITGFNPSAERLFGWDAEDVHGRSAAELLVPSRERARQTGDRDAWRGGPDGRLLGRVQEVVALRRDGSEVPIDLSVSVGVSDGERRTFVAFARDVSGRARAERLQGLRFVVASVLSQSSSLTEAIAGVLAATCTRLRLPVGAVWIPTSSGLVSEHHWAADRARMAGFVDQLRAAPIAAGEGLPGRVWSTGRAATLTELGEPLEASARREATAAAGLVDAVAVPIAAGDRILAVLEVFADRARDLDDETVRTLDDLAGQLGQFVARRRAEMALDTPERLGLLMEGAAEAVVTVAEDGSITGFNEPARRLFGYSTLDVVGEDLRVLVADESREPVVEYVSELLRLSAGDPPRWLEVLARRKDGGTFDAGVHITPLVVGGRQAFLCIVDERRAVRQRFTGGPADLRVYDGRVDEEQQPRLA